MFYTGVNDKLQNQNGNRALHIAAQKGHHEAMQQLIDAGNNVVVMSIEEKYSSTCKIIQTDFKPRSNIFSLIRKFVIGNIPKSQDIPRINEGL